MAFSLEVEIVADAPLPSDVQPAELKRLIEHILRSESRSGNWAVNVALVPDQALRELHRDFLGIDTETDVMTFPLEPDSWDETRGGDIAISVDRAADQAPEYGLTVWEEIRFLTAHGTLHLCGWDDSDDAERSRMLDRQRELIESFDRADA